MTTGWPRNQEDLRWPHSDSDETGPGSQAGGRVATDSDRANAASGFGTEHPSGPLPITPAAQPRSRFGRRSRDSELDELRPAEGADADYDWIKYLGEAGPAQEHSRRSADAGARRLRGNGAVEPRAASSGAVPRLTMRRRTTRRPARLRLRSCHRRRRAGRAGLGSSGHAPWNGRLVTTTGGPRIIRFRTPRRVSAAAGGSLTVRIPITVRLPAGRAEGPAAQGFGTSAADTTSVFSADPEPALAPPEPGPQTEPCGPSVRTGRITSAGQTGAADRSRPSGRIAGCGPSVRTGRIASAGQTGPAGRNRPSGQDRNVRPEQPAAWPEHSAWPERSQPDSWQTGPSQRAGSPGQGGRFPGYRVAGDLEPFLARAGWACSGAPPAFPVPAAADEWPAAVKVSGLACVGADRTPTAGRSRARLRPIMPTAGTGRARDAPASRR